MTKTILAFIPQCFNDERLPSSMAKLLGLRIEDRQKGSPYDFSAQRGDQESYMLLQYKKNNQSTIEELCEWERPTIKYKNLLKDCRASITLNYRNKREAIRFFFALDNNIGGVSSQCIVENGMGCLLLLSDIVNHLKDDEFWSWERQEFPELDEVAISEWLE